MKRPSEMRTRQVQFRMSDRLYKAFKLALAMDDKSMIDMLNDAIREYVKSKGIDPLNLMKWG